MNLGAAIKAIRVKKNIKQYSLANNCGISKTYLSQIENNVKVPNISILKLISQNLEVPVPILFFLSIDANDIPVEKREAYLLLEPTIKNIIDDILTETKLP